MKRPLIVYLPIIVFIGIMGPLSREWADRLPYWVGAYVGDFLWAMEVFFLCCLVLRLKTLNACLIALAISYGIETSQLFDPPWLENLRSIKLFALILGFKFFWSDIVAYTLGIASAASIDWLIVNFRAKS